MRPSDVLRTPHRTRRGYRGITPTAASNARDAAERESARAFAERVRAREAAELEAAAAVLDRGTR